MSSSARLLDRKTFYLFLSYCQHAHCVRQLQLIEMGFAEVRAKKGLMFGNGSDLENAVNWLMEHQAREERGQSNIFVSCTALLLRLLLLFSFSSAFFFFAFFAFFC